MITQNMWTWVCIDKTAVFFYLIAIFYFFSLGVSSLREGISILYANSENFWETVYISSYSS